jgi:hypothetical protein
MPQPVAKEFKPSDIKFSATIYELGESGEELQALVIKFSGSYGYGSAGNGDAIYMIAIRDYLVNCTLPSAIVFDLRELSYEWGNAIWDLFRCDEPFATLLTDRPNSSKNPAVFDNVEQALDYLTPRARAYEKSLRR